MSIYELAEQLGLSVSSDNIAEIPIIILNEHLFISESKTYNMFDLNNTLTMEWRTISASSLMNYCFSV
ncbi:hypothetical protein RYH73_09770 [Olivibacter sp. CPCC 100613]|uniref:hypothetical protein n=1 Tax=Olivibacter sp. CPCC 100613 TaxID=3079931 RepID=UPI002FF6D8EE